MAKKLYGDCVDIGTNSGKKCINVFARSKKEAKKKIRKKLESEFEGKIGSIVPELQAKKYNKGKFRR